DAAGESASQAGAAWLSATVTDQSESGLPGPAPRCRGSRAEHQSAGPPRQARRRAARPADSPQIRAGPAKINETRVACASDPCSGCATCATLQTVHFEKSSVLRKFVRGATRDSGLEE